MNFYDLLKARAEVFGDKIFLQVDGKSFSYKNFLAAVDGTADDVKFFTQIVKSLSAQKKNRSKIFEVTTSGSTSSPKILSRTFESWTDFFPT
ncbi:MAG: hypothetical protein IKG61_04035, partial [Selenomonadaceae bacterium]|nr:hypothetical protein [Selenomonadaceae bacterium]